LRQPQPEQYCAEIRASAGRLADLIATRDPDLPVPSCPGWALHDLGAHLGRVHRWAAQIVTSGATERIPFSSVPGSEYPAGQDEQAAWLRAGAEQVITATSAAGPAPVWAFGSIAPAGFWARRQSHETMVHRADGEIAAGQEVVLDPVLAADGIDEWLSMVANPRNRRRPEGTEVLPPGAVLGLRAVAPDGDSSDWLLSASDGQVTVRSGSDGSGASGDATATGPPGPLLLVLLRRLPPDDPRITVTGDTALLSGWLAATPF
jgi:uncharacterized protein (TIGR03083 family)